MHAQGNPHLMKSMCCAVWRGSGGAVLRRGQVAHALARKPGHYFYELLFWQTLVLCLRQSTEAFGRFSSIFYVKANSHPEVVPDCTRHKEFIRRWRRWRSPFYGHFSHSVQLDDGQQLLVVEGSRAVLRFSLTRCRETSLLISRPLHLHHLHHHQASDSSVPTFLLCVTCESMDLIEQPVSGAAQRRRERRLHSMLWHERMTVAMALAEFSQNSSRGQRMAYTAKIRKPPHTPAGALQPR